MTAHVLCSVPLHDLLRWLAGLRNACNDLHLFGAPNAPVLAMRISAIRMSSFEEVRDPKVSKRALDSLAKLVGASKLSVSSSYTTSLRAPISSPRSLSLNQNKPILLLMRCGKRYGKRPTRGHEWYSHLLSVAVMWFWMSARLEVRSCIHGTAEHQRWRLRSSNPTCDDPEVAREAAVLWCTKDSMGRPFPPPLQKTAWSPFPGISAQKRKQVTTQRRGCCKRWQEGSGTPAVDLLRAAR